MTKQSSCIEKDLIEAWCDANGTKAVSSYEQLNSHYIPIVHTELTHCNQLDKTIVVCCIIFPSSLSFLILFRCIQTEDEQALKSMKSCINETLTTVAQYFGQLIELVLAHEAQVTL